MSRPALDHVVAAMVMQAAGRDALDVTHTSPNDAGGHRGWQALLSGEIKALVHGLSEAIDLSRSGEIQDHRRLQSPRTRAGVARVELTMK